MTTNWLFREVPLDCRAVRLANECAALGLARLAEAGEVLRSPEEARSAAFRAGRYELGEEEVRALGLAGAALDPGGEVPALSPARWTELSESEDHAGEFVGLLLSEREEHDFLRFLSKNHGSGRELAAHQAVELARHYFFMSPVQAVIRSGA